MHTLQKILYLTLLSLFPIFAAAQDLMIGKLAIDVTQSADIHSADITGNVHFDAETKTLTLNQVTLTNALIQNNNVNGLNICLKGKNHIINPTGALFLLKPTRITGDGSLLTSCATDYSDIYHEASLMIENSTITVGAFRGTFRAFLEIHHASITSLRGIFWHNGVVLKDCEIVQPLGGVYDAIERAISLHGRIYQRKVVIERMKTSGITPPEVKAAEKSFYNIHGQPVTCPDKGFFIVKHANGKVEKVIR